MQRAGCRKQVYFSARMRAAPEDCLCFHPGFGTVQRGQCLSVKVDGKKMRMSGT